MAQTLYLIQNDAEVPPGIIAGLLEQRRIPFRVIMPGKGESLPAPDEAAAVIILGGAMGVGDTAAFPFLREVKWFIGEYVTRDLPFLGICLGGQLLAEVLGGSVTSRHRGEQGVCGVSLTAEGAADPLFRGIPPEFVTYQWHNDSFDLPGGCRLLASSTVCPQQAIRHGSRVYGLQFHPEVTAAIVTAWSGAVATDAGYLTSFMQAEKEYRAAACALLDNFFRIANLVQ